MIKATSLAAALMALTLCNVANAQAARTDAEYCASLIETYERYIGGSQFGSRHLSKAGDLEGRVAVAQCQQGNTAPGIPVLEGKLRANGFSLPKRG
jgi:hypothetical protein